MPWTPRRLRRERGAAAAKRDTVLASSPLHFEEVDGRDRSQARYLETTRKGKVTGNGLLLVSASAVHSDSRPLLQSAASARSKPRDGPRPRESNDDPAPGWAGLLAFFGFFASAGGPVGGL